MFTLAQEDKKVFAIWLPILVVILLFVFAITGSAQTNVVENSATVGKEATIVKLATLRLQAIQMINEVNRFNTEEVQPALDKAIASNTVLEQKQEMLKKAGEEIAKLQTEYKTAKDTLEKETGCILIEDTMSLDCKE